MLTQYCLSWFGGLGDKQQTSPGATARRSARPLTRPELRDAGDTREGLLPVLSIPELLKPHQALLVQLNELAGVPEAAFNGLYRVAIHQLARFVQQLPASEVHHHAGLGGLLAHSLEVAVLALRLRRSYLFSSQAGAEEIAKKHDLWTYAVFLGALCHDLGKPAMDQQVEVFVKPGSEPALWQPFGQFIDEQGAFYRNAFVRDRVYQLHEKAAPLLIYRIVPVSGLQWLNSDKAILAHWIATIAGDHEQAHGVGEIVNQADGQSVAKNLGAGSQRLPTVKTKPLHEKLLTSLRYLLNSGELPLNRNGAAAWVKNGDCWLVSKRTIDAIRNQLTQEGHSGVPTQNSRLFDVLQEHGVISPCGEKAIWRVTLIGDDWRNELTVMRMPVVKLWPNPDTKPDDFTGEVLLEGNAEVVAEDETTEPIASPETTIAYVDEPSDRIRTARLAQSALIVAEGHLPVSGDLVDSGDERAYLPSLIGATKSTARPVTADFDQQTFSESPLDAIKPKTPKLNLKPKVEAPSNPSGGAANLADDFIVWVQAGIQQRSIAVNNPEARLHVVAEGVLLVTPGIFQNYASATDRDWLTVQKQVLKRNWHVKDAKGLNVFKYQVAGKQKRSSVNGILFPDTALIFGQGVSPKPNPHLSQILSV